MEIDEIVKNMGKKILTPKGRQLLAGMQIGVLIEKNQQRAYPRSIWLLCWSEDGGQYFHCARDCKI